MDFTNSVGNENLMQGINSLELHQIFTLVLKDSIIQLLKHVAPIVYKYRFDHVLVKQAVENYLESNQDSYLTLMF